jgi:hypothetical protein
MPLIKHDDDAIAFDDGNWKAFIEHPRAHEEMESYLVVLELAKKHGFSGIERGARKWLDAVNSRIEKPEAEASEALN